MIEAIKQIAGNAPGTTSVRIKEPMPRSQIERHQAMDALRGFAVLGILLVNILSFALPYQVNFKIDIRNEFNGPNFYSWMFVNVFVEGTMRALFSILFGAGAILLLNGLEKKGSQQETAADIYYRRLIYLLLFGLINGYLLIWPGDVLYPYAICGFFLYPLRKSGAKTLLIIGLLFLSVSTFKATQGWHKKETMREQGEAALALEAKKVELTNQQKEDKAKWMAYQENNDLQKLKQDASETKYEMRNGYRFLVRLYSGVTKKRETTDFYDTIFWDIIAFFFIGMAFLKMKLLTGERTTRFYFVLLALGYGIGLTISYSQLQAMLNLNFDETRMAALFPVDLYQLKRLFIATGHIALIMLWHKLRIMKRLFQALAKVGQMTLTNYLSQALIGGLLFYGFGLALFDRFQRYEVYLIVTVIWVFQIVLSNIWLHYFAYGPAEWLLRSLTYRKIQPILKR